MNTWIVILNDRHADIEAFAFDNPNNAVNYAKELVKRYGRFPEDIQEREYRIYLYYCTYSCEGDYVAVLKEQELNATP